MNWISVETEPLPEGEEVVAAQINDPPNAFGHEIALGTRHGDTFWWSNVGEHGWTVDSVTHFLRLPPLPEVAP